MNYIEFGRFMATHVCDEYCKDWTYEQHRLMANFYEMLAGVR